MSKPASAWRTDFGRAIGTDVILLTKSGGIASGKYRPTSDCWWIIGGGTLYMDQLAGWLPRDALPDAPAQQSNG